MRWHLPATLLLSLSIGCADRLKPTEATPPPRTVLLDQSDGDAAALLERARSRNLDGPVLLSLMTDKPMYQPGETIRFRLDVRDGRGRSAVPKGSVRFELLDPRESKAGLVNGAISFGVASGAFALTRKSVGGTYTLRAEHPERTITREITVGTYRAEKLKKELEFARTGYSAGDKMTVRVRFLRGTGEPLAGADIGGQLLFGDTAETTVRGKTDKNGRATLTITLPGSLVDRPNLAVTAFDGGTVESIVRPVPIRAGPPKVTLRPEGGNLVAGLPSRVFLKAVDEFGEPTDVSGRLLDDNGVEVSRIESVRDGYGVFDLQPEKGRAYKVVLDGEKTEAPLEVESAGCVVRALDGAGSYEAEIRVSLACTKAQKLLLTLEGRGGGLSASGSAQVRAREPLVVTVPFASDDTGLVDITVHNEDKEVLAQRAIFRGADRRMTISIQPASDEVAPGAAVRLAIETRDEHGRPSPASVGVAVADDAVLAMADDKQADLFTQIFLGDLVLDKLPAPSFYLSEAAGAREALDALIGLETWSYVAAPPEPLVFTTPSGDSRIRGTIVDSTGQPLLGVTVVATSPTLKGSVSAISEGGGRYQLAVPPGLYQVVFYYGDSQLKRSNVHARLNKTTAVNVRFDMSNSGEMILIEQRAPVIDATNTSVGVTITTDSTRNIPALGRTFEAALEAAAGSSADGMGVSFSGSSDLENRYLDSFQPDTPSDDGPHIRTRFLETVYWHPNIRTNGQGRASIGFELGDSITSYRAIAGGFSVGGAAGVGEATFAAVKPLSIEALIASHAQLGDRLDHAATVVNRTDEKVTAVVKLRARGLKLQVEGGWGKRRSSPNSIVRRLVLAPRERKTISVKARPARLGRGRIDLSVTSGVRRDRVVRSIDISPRGYPQTASISGIAKKTQTLTLELPNAIAGATAAELAILPSSVSRMTEGADSILRQPSGCFEQTSSSNYPNIMALRLLNMAGKSNYKLERRARGLLAKGYKRLVGFESEGGGFEWFGGSPANESLTAYGLVQFNDMKEVYPHVDSQMIERTTRWLLGRRNGKGGYNHSDRALDQIGRASRATADAYVTFSLAEVGEGRRLGTELKALNARAAKTDDPYIVALAVAANAAAKKRSSTLAGRLATMQASDGSFPGASDSITHSGGESLIIESTALAAYALLRAETHSGVAAKAISWLHTKRQGGAYGSTQGTVLSLKAMVLFGVRTEAKKGTVTIRINGGKKRRLRFDGRTSRAYRLGNLGRALRAGTNVIELESTTRVPFSLTARYRTPSAVEKPHSPLAVTTRLSKRHMSRGAAATIKTTVRNRSADGLGMTLVRVALPSGFTTTPQQLDALRKVGTVDFVETRPREVNVYLRGMKAKETRTIDIAVVASIGGRVHSAPSSAALYYEPEANAWAPPLDAVIR